MGWEMPYTIEVPLLPRDAGDPEADRSHPNRGTIQKRIDPMIRRDEGPPLGSGRARLPVLGVSETKLQ